MSSARRCAPNRHASFHNMNSRVSFQTESSQSRHLIWSHISTWMPQEVTQTFGESESDNNNRSHAPAISYFNAGAETTIKMEAGVFPSSSTSPSNRSQSTDWEVGKTARSSCDENRPAVIRTNKVKAKGASNPSLLLYSIDYTSAGTLDPFKTYPSSLPPGFVNWCLKYS